MAANDGQFDALIDRYGAMLGRIVASYEANPAMRQDLMQDIWLRIWRGYATFRGDGEEKGFIARIARNCCISHVARAVGEPKSVELDMDAPSDEASPEAQADQALKRQKLEAMVRALPLEQREVIILCLEGFSHADVAHALDISENAVASRFSRAKAALVGKTS